MLSAMRPWAENGDKAFMKRWQAIRLHNKQRLADLVKRSTGVTFDPTALFDIQVKRIHEYKRQLLNVLHIVHLYNRIRRGDTADWVNRCVLIGGKAAPGYQRAKEIIKLINNIASVVNNDPAVGGRLKVVFLPNYGVSKMMDICPAADLSEQISTAGKEASGTGNMKFMMNGAITIGTYDGANIEIMDAVGEENFFLFGLDADEVKALRGNYRPQHYIDADPDLADVIGLLESDHFSGMEPGLFRGPDRQHDQPARPVGDTRRFPQLCRCPATRGTGLAGPGELDPDEHPQLRGQRRFLDRPDDRRIQQRHLETAAARHAGDTVTLTWGVPSAVRRVET